MKIASLVWEKTLISKSLSFQTTQPSTTDERRQQIKEWMQLCRAGTLALFEGVDYNSFCHQPHPEFSPVGWHLGHIAYTESLWLLERCAGKSSQFKQYHSLFASDGLPKGKRVHLPTLAEVIGYLDTVRKQVFDYLKVAPLDEQERLWRFMIQHESQHSEIICFLLQLQSRSLVISQSSLVSRQSSLVISVGASSPISVMHIENICKLALPDCKPGLILKLGFENSVTGSNHSLFNRLFRGFSFHSHSLGC